jgi:hypothetical protein
VTKRLAAAGLVLLLAGAGCGNRRAPDLFVLTRTGTVPGAQLRLRVSDDGLVRCNGGAPRRLPDARLLDAREIARELEGPAGRDVALPPRRSSILRYRLVLEAGTVAFSDNSRGQTAAMFRTQDFARQVARQVCRLAR